MSERPWIEVAADLEDLAGRAARLFSEAARAAVAARGRFAVALSGGSTPRPVYERLAGPHHREEVPWARIEFFWADERCVPPEAPDSNYRMARETLLDRVAVDPERVHRIRGEAEPAAAARECAGELRRALDAAGEEPPHLDLALLGLGPDGHTASLFPDSAAIESDRLAEAVPAALVLPPVVDRVTLTPVALNAARAVAFLVSGGSKAAAVRAALEGPRDPARCPAQAIAPTRGRARWLLDAEAAAGLEGLDRPAAKGP
ncbi:MAG TPA: 6-phosphogluconolactonase [Gemmatimonadota bacterium]|nr:6-phosphogluconolactonase [Gemmatimonadota bacterium]